MYENEISYYTSGTRGLAYLHGRGRPRDLPDRRVRRLAALRGLFPDAYYRASRRGQNQYLKVRYSSPEQFNALCDKIQAKVRMLFLARGILCDFETKGKITTDEKSGSLAKLPFQVPYPCNMRDETDTWNYAAMIRFHTAPVYTVEEIDAILDGIVIDADAATATVKKKETLEKLVGALDKSNATAAQKTMVVERIKQVFTPETKDDLEHYLYEKVLRNERPSHAQKYNCWNHHAKRKTTTPRCLHKYNYRKRHDRHGRRRCLQEKLERPAPLCEAVFQAPSEIAHHGRGFDLLARQWAVLRGLGGYRQQGSKGRFDPATNRRGLR